jgi:hypothetical protein
MFGPLRTWPALDIWTVLYLWRWRLFRFAGSGACRLVVICRSSPACVLVPVGFVSVVLVSVVLVRLELSRFNWIGLILPFMLVGGCPLLRQINAFEKDADGKMKRRYGATHRMRSRNFFDGHPFLQNEKPRFRNRGCTLLVRRLPYSGFFARRRLPRRTPRPLPFSPKSDKVLAKSAISQLCITDQHKTLLGKVQFGETCSYGVERGDDLICGG